ncbi:hypothetical protein BRARA_F02406 [Brassica rapa]|uniref:Uncharacterized protein n=1 Tax=Brassica campestris TaxID=3711 RepID=A0A397Z717_BRACM|nr:hypothetical protein BRARA_F02406 [Brassica rapa]
MLFLVINIMSKNSLVDVWTVQSCGSAFSSPIRCLSLHFIGYPEQRTGLHVLDSIKCTNLLIKCQREERCRGFDKSFLFSFGSSSLLGERRFSPFRWLPSTKRRRFYQWFLARKENGDLSIGGSPRRGGWRPLSLSVALCDEEQRRLLRLRRIERWIDQEA